MPYYSSQDFAEPTSSIPPDPLLHAAVGRPGQVRHILNAFPLAQLLESLQSGAPLEMRLFLITVFKLLTTLLPVNFELPFHPFTPHPLAIHPHFIRSYCTLHAPPPYAVYPELV